MAIVASQANRGFLVLNPNFLQSSGDYDFLNLTKHCQLPLKLADNSNVVSPADLDPNGYPTVLNGGGWYTIFSIPSPASRSGNYVVTWSGNGTVVVSNRIIAGTMQLISGSYTGSGGSGRYVFNTTDTSLEVRVTGVPITNLQMFHQDDEQDILAGYITGKKLRQRIAEGQPFIWRNLNWGGGAFTGANWTNMSTWATRKPVGYISYAGTELRHDLFAGNTTKGSGPDYSVTYGSGPPVDKTTIIVKFDADSGNRYDDSGNVTITDGSPSTLNWTSHGLTANEPFGFGGFLGLHLPTPLTQWTTYYVKTVIDANSFTFSATPGGTAISTSGGSSGITIARLITFNLNGTGAIVARDAAGQIMWATGSNTPTANVYATLIYDAPLGFWFLWGGNLGFNSVGLENGVPPEVFIQVTNELGCHPWFCSPHMATDPMTDWHTQLATLCKITCAPWAIPVFECLNEPWNGSTADASYAYLKGYFNWNETFVAGELNFIGKIGSTIGQDINRVYGGPVDGSKYKVYLNAQLYGSATPSALLDSTDYVAQAAAPQTGYTKTPARKWVTHVCVSQYFYFAGDISSYRTQWTAADGNPSLQQQIVDTALADPVIGVPPTLTDINVRYNLFGSWLSGYNTINGTNIKLAGYEGGFATPADAFGAATKNGTLLESYYLTNINNFLAAGGVNPAEFQLASLGFDQWSIFTDIYQSPDPPQWKAIVSLVPAIVLPPASQQSQYGGRRRKRTPEEQERYDQWRKYLKEQEEEAEKLREAVRSQLKDIVVRKGTAKPASTIDLAPVVRPAPPVILAAKLANLQSAARDFEIDEEDAELIAHLLS